MADSYSTLKYNSKERWLSYWYQISEVLEVAPESVLVVGKGSGIVEGLVSRLSECDMRVVTLDINTALKPGVAGSVTDIPFKDDAFDAALCCQVLEHITFECFAAAMDELHRVAKRRVVISLPHGRKHIKLSCTLPFTGEKSIILKNPLTKKACSSRQHFWEIGRGISRSQVVEQLSRRFSVEKEFLNEISCDHRFFVLKRKAGM